MSAPLGGTGAPGGAPDAAPHGRRGALAVLALLAAAGAVVMRAWFVDDLMPPGDFPGYAAVVAEVRDALLRYGRVPAWCGACFGGTTVFVSSLKEYLAFPLAVAVGPVLATKILFLVMKVAGAFGVYLLLARLFAAPGAGLVAAWAYGFGALANHETEHLDVAVSRALFPFVCLAAVATLRGREPRAAVGLGLLLACQLANNAVQLVACGLLIGLLLALRPWCEGGPAARRAALGGLALGVFLLAGGSQLAWLAADGGNHFLIAPETAAAQRALYSERSPFLFVNRGNWLAPWLATHQPPGLDVVEFDGERRYLGVVALAVALGGWLAVRGREGLRRWYQVAALLLLAQYWLALGPHTLVWQLGRTFGWGAAAEAGARTALVTAAGGALAGAALAAARGSWRRAGLLLGLALVFGFPVVSLFEALRTGVPGVGPWLDLQRSPGHFFDLAPFALSLLLGLALAAGRGRAGRVLVAAVGVLVVLDFWPSTAAFRRGTPLGPLEAFVPRLAELPAEDGTLRLVVLPGDHPLHSWLAAASGAGRAWGWLPWQAGKHWPPFMLAAAWQFQSAFERAARGERHGGDALLALGRLRYLLVEAEGNVRLPPPWRRRAQSGAFGIWEQPGVGPMAAGYPWYLLFVGEPDEAALPLVPDAADRNALVVSAGPRLSDADEELLTGAVLVRAEGDRALGDERSRALAARNVDKVIDPRRASEARWRTLVGGLPARPLVPVVYERPAPERIVLRLDAGAAPAAVFVSEAYHPWWRATVDGAPAPVLRAQTTFLAVRVGPGRHEILLRLVRPPLVAAADAVSVATWAACALAAMASGIAWRRRPA